MPRNKKTLKGSKKGGENPASIKNNGSKPHINQKKMHKSITSIRNKDQNQNNNYTKFSTKLFKESTYMPEFVKEIASDNTLCKCIKCPDSETKKLGKVIIVNNLYAHIKSKQHQINTPTNEKGKLDKLIKLLDDKKEKTSSDHLEEKETQDIKNYLHFIAFGISQNLSYSQIQSLGAYLQKASRDRKLGFLKGYSFDEQLISKISQNCFRPLLLGEIKDHLSSQPYSLIIDNVTFSGESFCALKVKYLAKEWNEDLQSNLTTIKNKIFSLSNLKESSSGQTIKSIVEDRLFSSEQIRSNLVGIAHDNASSLTSPNIGLITLLEQSGNNFFDLKDPCHGLNLTLKHSLKDLPTEIMNFVESISNHFAYPQRKAALRKIQEENNLQILYPKQIASTRWLSLGECLVRIIDIWGSLVGYFEKLEETKKHKKKRKSKKSEDKKGKTITSKDLKQLLSDEVSI